MTTFVYDVSKPNLIPGRRYAWRVRAISTGGLAENSVFKNNGYSEVHSFVYAVNCNKPLFLLSQQQSKSRTKLLWQGDTQHQKYHIQYRKKGVANAQWFDTSTRNTQALITNLEAGEYEFRVGATCETERYDITPSYVYSNIQTFEIEKTQNTTESAYNCGIAPKIAITNKKPLGSLVTNEVFTAGDFSVTILEVSGSNGIFSGKGFVKVPYLNDTKLAVEFENIKINADYQLTDGIVKTIYDSDWKGVQFAENLIGQGEKSKDIDVPFEIEKVETRNGEIVVIGKDGRKDQIAHSDSNPDCHDQENGHQLLGSSRCGTETNQTEGPHDSNPCSQTSIDQEDNNCNQGRQKRQTHHKGFAVNRLKLVNLGNDQTQKQGHSDCQHHHSRIYGRIGKNIIK